jgi:hypothetical protein
VPRKEHVAEDNDTGERCEEEKASVGWNFLVPGQCQRLNGGRLHLS